MPRGLEVMVKRNGRGREVPLKRVGDFPQFEGIPLLRFTDLEQLDGLFEVADDKEYTLIQRAYYAVRLEGIALQTLSGECIVDIEIDGVPVTGLAALEVDSAGLVAAATALRTVALGQQVTMIVSSNASALDLAFSLASTRTL